MRSFVAGVAASMVASAAIYLVLTATEASSLPVRLIVMALVLVIGTVAAGVASRSDRDPDEAGATVGHRIDADDDIAVERVDVESPAGGTRIGTDLKARGAVRVSDVRVVRTEDSE